MHQYNSVDLGWGLQVYALIHHISVPSRSIFHFFISFLFPMQLQMIQRNLILFFLLESPIIFCHTCLFSRFQGILGSSQVLLKFFLGSTQVLRFNNGIVVGNLQLQGWQGCRFCSHLHTNGCRNGLKINTFDTGLESLESTTMKLT